MFDLLAGTLVVLALIQFGVAIGLCLGALLHGTKRADRAVVPPPPVPEALPAGVLPFPSVRADLMRRVN